MNRRERATESGRTHGRIMSIVAPGKIIPCHTDCPRNVRSKTFGVLFHLPLGRKKVTQSHIYMCIPRRFLSNLRMPLDLTIDYENEDSSTCTTCFLVKCYFFKILTTIEILQSIVGLIILVAFEYVPSSQRHVSIASQGASPEIR